jgi:hypothetical protein
MPTDSQPFLMIAGISAAHRMVVAQHMSKIMCPVEWNASYVPSRHGETRLTGCNLYSLGKNTEADIEKYYRAAVIDCRSDRSNVHHGVIQYAFSMTAAVVTKCAIHTPDHDEHLYWNKAMRLRC